MSSANDEKKTTESTPLGQENPFEYKYIDDRGGDDPFQAISGRMNQSKPTNSSSGLEKSTELILFVNQHSVKKIHFLNVLML